MIILEEFPINPEVDTWHVGDRYQLRINEETADLELYWMNDFTDGWVRDYSSEYFAGFDPFPIFK